MRTSRCLRSRARAADDRAASTVELAIIAPILVLMFVGIVDFGAVYSDQIELRQGGREGARQLVQGNIGPEACGDVEERMICLVKDRSGLDDGSTRVGIRFENDEFKEDDWVAVCLARPARSLTGFFGFLLDGAERVITTKTLMRMQVDAAPGSALEGAGNKFETFPYPSGSADPAADWAWCTADPTT
jgi:hypothetical protein